MPFTKRQINRILKVKGKHFIDPNRRMSLAARVTESFIRRRLYAIEDQAVIDQFGMYRTAYDEINLRAGQLAQEFDVSMFKQDSAGIMFRRGLLAYIEPRLQGLAQEVARHAFEQATEMYMAGYYGRLWALDMQTGEDVTINTPLPHAADVSAKVLMPDLQEAFKPDEIIWQLLGREWREEYASTLDDLIIRMRRSLTTSMTQGLGVPQTMRNLADTMGVVIDRRRIGVPNVRANFNRVQVVTRTFMLSASNQGALDAYRENSDVLLGIQWLTSIDGRQCKLCEGLDGEIWPVDSPDVKMPPGDSHPNCRCTLIPVLQEQETLTTDPPPSSTFPEWIIGLGLAWVLDDFLDGWKLESTLE